MGSIFLQINPQVDLIFLYDTILIQITLETSLDFTISPSNFITYLKVRVTQREAEIERVGEKIPTAGSLLI